MKNFENGILPRKNAENSKNDTGGSRVKMVVQVSAVRGGRNDFTTLYDGAQGTAAPYLSPVSTGLAWAEVGTVFNRFQLNSTVLNWWGGGG